MSLRRFLPLAAALALLLGGCLLRHDPAEDGGVYVYRLRTEQSGEDNRALCAERVQPLEGESLTECLTRALNSEPVEENYVRVFPEGVELLSCRMGNGRAVAEMSPGYRRLDGVDRVLCDYALVCTLFRLDPVTDVEISCAGAAVQSGLRPDRVELGDAQYGSGERIIKLFVPDDGGESLVSRSFVITRGAEDAAAAAVRQLIVSLDEVPDTTALKSLSVSEGLCVVNLSEEFYTTEPESVHTSRLVIGSFVDTLCFLPEVERVVIQVGGAPISSYGSCVLTWPAETDESLISYDGG